MSTIALDTFTKQAVLKQITKRAGIDWNNIGEGAAYGGLGGGALGGIGSYLFSKEKDGNKRSKDALKSALMGAGLGAATGAGVNAFRHALPEVIGGHSEASNPITQGLGKTTGAAMGAKNIAEVAPFAGVAAGAVKDYDMYKDIGKATSQEGFEKFKTDLSSKNRFEDLVNPKQGPQPFGGNNTPLDTTAIRDNAKLMDSHILNTSGGNSLKAAGNAASEFAKHKIDGATITAITHAMKTGDFSGVDPQVLSKLTDNPYLGSLVKDSIIGANPALAQSIPGHTGFNTLTKGPTNNHWFSGVEDFMKRKALDPESHVGGMARTASHIPNTARLGLPALAGGIGANELINQYMNYVEPDAMAKQKAWVDMVRGQKKP